MQEIRVTKNLSKDKKALDHMSVHRTVAAYKLCFCVALTFKDKLMNDLKSTFFTLNLDETTSSNHQRVVIVLVNYRIFSNISREFLGDFTKIKLGVRLIHEYTLPQKKITS